MVLQQDTVSLFPNASSLFTSDEAFDTDSDQATVVPAPTLRQDDLFATITSSYLSKHPEPEKFTKVRDSGS